MRFGGITCSIGESSRPAGSGSDGGGDLERDFGGWAILGQFACCRLAAGCSRDIGFPVSRKKVFPGRSPRCSVFFSSQCRLSGVRPSKPWALGRPAWWCVVVKGAQRCRFQHPTGERIR